MVKSDLTYIPCKKSTRQKLKNYGKKGQTYDDVLNELLEKAVVVK